MFLTGTAAEVVAVTKLDGRAIGSGKPGAHHSSARQALQGRSPREGTDDPQLLTGLWVSQHIGGPLFCKVVDACHGESSPTVTKFGHVDALADARPTPEHGS